MLTAGKVESSMRNATASREATTCLTEEIKIDSSTDYPFERKFDKTGLGNLHISSFM
jgi:hypothetical protein